MTIKTKKLSYKGCKNVLCRVAYKLVKQGKSYKYPKNVTINGKKQTYKEIIKKIKEHGTTYGHDEYISRFIEEVVAMNDKTILPGYVIGSSGRTKYNRTSYRNIAKTLRDYRNKNGKNPAEITVSYEPYQKLYDYITKQGCSGMGQCTPYNCADNALQQMFYRLTGIFVDESTIAKWAGTTIDGTGHGGINTAVAQFNKKYDKNIKIEWYNFSSLGKTSDERWEKVKTMMNKGALFFHLLYRYKPNQSEGYGHYEVPYKIGESLKILNSLGDRCGGSSYCGYIETRTRKEQEVYISGISQKSVAYLYNG